MSQREPLSLKHQSLLEPLFKKLNLEISEYSFANAYLFRQVHDFEVFFDKSIFLVGKTRDGLRRCRTFSSGCVPSMVTKC